MAPHSSTLAWKIPWMEEPGRLQSMGSLRVGHDWATSLLLFTFIHWRRKWQPTPVFLNGESQGQRSLLGCHPWDVVQSRTRLMRLSSSSSSSCIGLPRWQSSKESACNAGAAAAKSLQSCLTLCDHIDGSPPGPAIPGILQARTLEWVSISSPMHENEKWKWSRSVVSNS